MSKPWSLAYWELDSPGLNAFVTRHLLPAVPRLLGSVRGGPKALATLCTIDDPMSLI